MSDEPTDPVQNSPAEPITALAEAGLNVIGADIPPVSSLPSDPKETADLYGPEKKRQEQSKQVFHWAFWSCLSSLRSCSFWYSWFGHCTSSCQTIPLQTLIYGFIVGLTKVSCNPSTSFSSVVRWAHWYQGILEQHFRERTLSQRRGNTLAFRPPDVGDRELVGRRIWQLASALRPV